MEEKSNVETSGVIICLSFNILRPIHATVGLIDPVAGIHAAEARVCSLFGRADAEANREHCRCCKFSSLEVE